MDNYKINKVRNRFLPIPEAVAKGIEPESNITDFEDFKSLGEGSFGKVNLAKHKKTGGVYAIKEIDKKNKNNQEGKPYFRREIEIMYKVNHPNVVKLFSHFEDDNKCYFVMEYVPKGNLFDLLSSQKTRCFETKTAALMIRDLISAVYYLHHMNPPIIHRDIKPENILINSEGRMKLADFGWSNYVDDNSQRETYCGTPVYLAPEMIKKIGHDEQLDIWCIGVLLFELLTGSIPFSGDSMPKLSDNILKIKINWPKDINLDAKNLISRILKPDPKDRISLEDMLIHPFITKVTPNAIDYLISPSSSPSEPFALTKDLPESVTTAEKKKKVYGSNNKLPQNNTPTTVEATKQIPSVQNQPKDDGMYSNIKDLYDKLKKDYEALTQSYNEVVVSKSSLAKKIEDITLKETFFKMEKENLLKEIEEKDNTRLHLMKQLAEANQKVQEKDDKLKNTTKLVALLNEKKQKDHEEIEKLNQDLDNLILQKEQEAKEYKEKLHELQNQIMKEDNVLENQISNIRQSLTSMSDRITTADSYSNINEKDHRVYFENELRQTKRILSDEMDNLRKETAKEREKYSQVLKNKEDEIRKLIEEKNILKENEAKKYEKILGKYEMILKLRESEIENLKVKIKKMENIISVSNIRK